MNMKNQKLKKIVSTRKEVPGNHINNFNYASLFFSQPSLYQRIAGNKLFGWRYFNSWMFIGLYHSVIVYFFAWIIWKDNNAVFAEGRTVDFLSFGVFMVQ